MRRTAWARGGEERRCQQRHKPGNQNPSPKVTDCSQVDIPDLRHKSVNFGVKWRAYYCIWRHMTLNRCSWSVFCSRGASPKYTPEGRGCTCVAGRGPEEREE